MQGGGLHQSAAGGEQQDDGDGGDDQTVETDPEGRFLRTRELVGRGRFKTVFKGFDQQQGIDVAWSKLDITRLSEAELHTVLHDIQTNLHLDHPNIIRSFKCWEDHESGTINLITELFTSGNLRQYRNHYKQLDLKAVKRMARQILRGLEYLHRAEPPITHGDLRCDKIYVNGNSGEIKIGDIGLATLLPYRSEGETAAAPAAGAAAQGQGQGQAPAQGSPVPASPAAAPQALSQEELQQQAQRLQGSQGSQGPQGPSALPCDPSFDIFAFGLCMLELLTLKQLDPQHCAGWQQLLETVPGEEARALISHCLSEPRPTAEELLHQPWLQVFRKIPTGGEGSMLPPTQSVDPPDGHGLGDPWRPGQESGDGPPPGSSGHIAIGQLRGEDYLFDFAGKVKEGKMHFRLVMTQAVQEPTNSGGPAFMRTIDFVFDPDVDTADKLAAEISETFNLSPTDTEICAAALREWLAREMPGLAENGK